MRKGSSAVERVRLAAELPHFHPFTGRSFILPRCWQTAGQSTLDMIAEALMHASTEFMKQKCARLLQNRRRALPIWRRKFRVDFAGNVIKIWNMKKPSLNVDFAYAWLNLVHQRLAIKRSDRVS